jgi:hypothetical protein
MDRLISCSNLFSSPAEDEALELLKVSRTAGQFDGVCTVTEHAKARNRFDFGSECSSVIRDKRSFGRSLMQRSRFSFQGKMILISGSSRGLGFLLAKQLLREGGRVAISARNSSELARAQTVSRRSNDLVLAIPCNLAERDQAQKMWRTVTRAFGPIDCLDQMPL